MIDRLPDQASWEDILYELYVKQKVEAGLAALTEDKTVAHEEVVRSAYPTRLRGRLNGSRPLTEMPPKPTTKSQESPTHPSQQAAFFCS